MIAEPFQIGQSRWFDNMDRGTGKLVLDRVAIQVVFWSLGGIFLRTSKSPGKSESIMSSVGI
jgi:hypothetical protein